MSESVNDTGVGDGSVAEQEIPRCGEHCGKCARCGVEIKTKPRQRFKGEAKRQRKTISIRVPADEAENGAQIYDDLLEQAQEKLKEIQGLDYLPTPYIVLIAALYELVTS